MRSDSDPQPSSPGDGAFETEGEPCDNDLECTSYLRCLSDVCGVPPAMEGEPGSETPSVRFDTDTDAGRTHFYVELATTEAERKKGLMERPEMQREWGMLFVFDRAEQRSFWMKNTLIPLDIIYLDSTGEVVNVIHEATPETTTPRYSEGPARFVVEINGGMAASAGIEPGTQMTVENIPDKYAPER